jgi:methyl-accepting chemotaxis protein
MKRAYQRRLFPIVDASLQYRFLALILVYCFLIIGVMMIPLFIPSMIQLQNADLSLEVRAAAADQILFLHTRIWPPLIALIGLIGIHSFIFFHRIVGPLFRFRRTYEQIGQGDIRTKIRIRKKDYLHKDCAAINGMVSELAEKLNAIRQKNYDALDTYKALEKTLSGENSIQDSNSDTLLRHRRKLEEALQAIHQFSLPEIPPAE